MDKKMLPTREQIAATADHAARQIPPLWPLNASVAVNPYLGQITQTLAETGAQLGRISQVPITLPRVWYAQQITSGKITDADLEAALLACADSPKPADVNVVRQAAYQVRKAPSVLPTILDIAQQASSMDWSGLMVERFGTWAGGYFDQGQALWNYPHGNSAWSSYRAYAIHDLTPEIIGLKGFASLVAELPQDPLDVIHRAVQQLALPKAALATYFHQLLFSLGGWAQFARYLQWHAELTGSSDNTVIDCLAIRLTWEVALYSQYQSSVKEAWSEVSRQHQQPAKASQDDVIDAILQEANERATQRWLAQQLPGSDTDVAPSRPCVQAVFCIDVRSEVFRRALEGQNTGIQTLGFAGFFGLATEHQDFASDLKEWRLPALLGPGLHSSSTRPAYSELDHAVRYVARAKRAWGRFKLAAVSCFAFVEAMGPVYVLKLLRDALGWLASPNLDKPAPYFDPALDLSASVDTAESVLRGLSLTQQFARLVLLVGHGANVTNNPHASGLHCGACGGYSGEVNARLLSLLLNATAVREGLAQRGIDIPSDTCFVAALHNTTTDQVKVYRQDVTSVQHDKDLDQLQRWLNDAGMVARGERALRLLGNTRRMTYRARNWAEVRPEWGLAGCSAFIVASRERTRGSDFRGRVFLHEYNSQQDAVNDYAVLTQIMTAPVVVASWISLQYYGSTVAPEVFGSGDKLLHNVVGGIGVFEGNGGLMRAGLAWQSVYDGKHYVHQPLRLTVCIEAPTEAITAIISNHEMLRALFDNRWLHLLAMDEQGQLAHRYIGNLTWEPILAPKMEMAS